MSRWLGVEVVVALCIALGAGVGPVWSSEISEESAVSIAENYDVDWIWGDVVSKTASSVTIKYLDYEDDMEKQMTIQVDANTQYENVASLDEIEPQDTLSIDYVMQENGDGLAQLVSKEEVMPADIEETGAALEGDILEPAADDSGISSIPME